MTVSGALELSWRDYDARETTPAGFVLNHERGDVSGPAVGLVVRGTSGQWALQAAHEAGDLVYDGFTQFGLPLRTSTSLGVNRLALGWVPWEPRLGPVTLWPGLQLTRQRITRAIRASPLSTPLTEKLDTTFVHAGVSMRLALSSRWSVQADGALGRPLAQRLLVDTAGIYDKFTLRPAARTVGRFGAGIAWQPSSDLCASLRIGHESWHFGSSGSRVITRDGVAVGSATYPGSRQRLDGVALHIEWLL